jgi:hypothetical protein
MPAIEGLAPIGRAIADIMMGDTLEWRETPGLRGLEASPVRFDS